MELFEESGSGLLTCRFWPKRKCNGGCAIVDKQIRAIQIERNFQEGEKSSEAQHEGRDCRQFFFQREEM